MPDEIEISVLLAVYNGELYIKEAIDSILSQTFSNFEFIIVNDGSTDSTVKIIKGYKDSRIVYIDNATNKGLIYSLNRGLSSCRGKYVARMDGDDIALPKRLQIQYDYMQLHPEVGICGGNVKTYFNDNRKNFVIRFPETDKQIRAFSFFQSPFNHPSVIIRKEILLQNNLQYREEFLHSEDYALWIELLRYTQGHNLSDILLHYRIHNESITAVTSKDKTHKTPVLIQQMYLEQNNIIISLDDIVLLSLFVNRDRKFDINEENQKKIEIILKSFFSQLYQSKKEYFSLVLDYVSSACFWRFYKAKKLPYESYLRKMMWRGFYAFVKKVPTYFNRIIISHS